MNKLPFNVAYHTPVKPSQERVEEVLALLGDELATVSMDAVRHVDLLMRACAYGDVPRSHDTSDLGALLRRLVDAWRRLGAP